MFKKQRLTLKPSVWQINYIVNICYFVSYCPFTFLYNNHINNKPLLKNIIVSLSDFMLYSLLRKL